MREEVEDGGDHSKHVRRLQHYVVEGFVSSKHADIIHSAAEVVNGFVVPGLFRRNTRKQSFKRQITFELVH